MKVGHCTTILTPSVLVHAKGSKMVYMQMTMEGKCKGQCIYSALDFTAGLAITQSVEVKMSFSANQVWNEKRILVFFMAHVFLTHKIHNGLR